MEHEVAFRNVPLGSVVLVGNQLWTVVLKGRVKEESSLAHLRTFDPPPRGWTTDYRAVPLGTTCTLLTEEEVLAWKPTPSRLVIEVKLGGDALPTVVEVKNAIESALLNQTADPHGPFDPYERGAIHDLNGNPVGKWEVV